MKKINTTEAMFKDQNLTPYLTTTNNNSQTPVLDEIGDMMGIDAKRNPSLTFWNLFFHKEYFKKKEILDATGLSERWYVMVIDEHYSPNIRKIRTTNSAHQILLKHLERKDLRYHQRLISELFLKTMLFLTWAERLEKYSYNEDFEDEAREEEPIDGTQYLITVEALEEAMNYLMAHFITTGSQSAA